MDKRGKTKLAIIISVFVILLVVTSLFSFSVLGQENNGNIGNGNSGTLTSQEAVKVEDKVNEVSTTSAIADATVEYVKDFAGKRDIPSENINSISEVDFNSLPKEVNIENVNDNNLGIYEVNYNETNSGNGVETPKKLFIITYSTEKLKEQGDLIIASDKRMLLNFGFNGQTTESRFLDTATGVQSSQEQGYVMTRDGSITAISTNLDIINASEGKVTIIVMKNGKAIPFGNTLETNSAGVKVDYDVQSNGVINFVPGDVISAYLSVEADNGEITYKNVITTLEITTK